jgi:hypothetical protein
VVGEELTNNLINFLVDLLIGSQLTYFRCANRSEDLLRELSEYFVVVVLADGEVNVVTSDHVLVQGADD